MAVPGSPATGSRCRRTPGPPGRVLAPNTESTGTTYSQIGLRPATTRHYRVQAINEIGLSPHSGVAHATTDAVAPDPPTDLVATAIEPTRIDLTWTAPAYDGGAPVTAYRIEVSEDAAAWIDLERSTGTDATSYSHTGLPPGSTRHYRVSAINAAGTGLPSGIASASTDDPVQRAGRVNQTVLPHFAAAMTTSILSAIAGRIEAVASRGPPPPRLSATGFLSLAGNPGLEDSGGGPNMRRLLHGATFALPLGAAAGSRQDDPGGGVGTWGGADHHVMGEPGADDIRWKGDMLTLHAGTDVRVRGDFLVGVAGSRSSGNWDFTDQTGAREVAGTYEAHMTSVNPYAAWLPGRTGVAMWAVGSFGWGEVEIDDELAGKRAGATRMTMGAVGGSNRLVTRQSWSLGLRAEGWLSRVEVLEREDMDGLDLQMRRARLALEWSRLQRFDGGHMVRLMFEGATRLDGGDATTGMGTELGGGFRYVNPSRALTMEGHGRVKTTGSSGYREWGVRGRIDFTPQGSDRGLSLKLVPAWGEAASGVQKLWERGVNEQSDVSRAGQQGRLNAQVQYRLPAFRGMPYGRLQVARGGERAFGTGMRYELARAVHLRLEGTRTQSAAGPARHRLTLRGLWRF